MKILNKYKIVIILYTVILIFFAGFNFKNKDNNMDFSVSMPDCMIVNKDENIGITKDFINYINRVTNVKKIDEDQEDDALFYRDVNYIIYINDGFRESLLKGENPQIEVKSTKDYQASLAQMLVERYLKLANVYVGLENSEEEIIRLVNEALLKTVEVEMMSTIDESSINDMARFCNFANYTILAVLMQVICLIVASFREINVNKRIIVSAKNYKKFSRDLLLSNMSFAGVLWFFYILLSFILIGDMVFSIHGLLFAFNLLVFVILALVIAFLIANIINNKDAVGGIVNVVALGSSFLCGAFVPMEFLPDSVLNIAHVLPSYWFIRNNEFIKTIEVFNREALKIYSINIIVLLLFILFFIFLINFVAKRKRQLN